MHAEDRAEHSIFSSTAEEDWEEPRSICWLAVAALVLGVLSFGAVFIPLMFLLRGEPSTYLGFVTLVGFVFGGCFVIYAAEVSRVYGVEGVNCVYPLLFLLYGLSALLGPAVGGWFYDWTGGYAPAVNVSVVLLLGAAFVAWTQRHRMVLAEAELAEEA